MFSLMSTGRMAGERQQSISQSNLMNATCSLSKKSLRARRPIQTLVIAEKSGWPDPPHVLIRESIGIELRQYVYQPRYCLTVVGEEPSYNRYAYQLETGWPLLALTGAALPIEPGYVDGIELENKIASPYLGRANVKILPTRPLMTGGAVNIMFYAAIWFGLLFGIGSFRRVIRRWQGYCPNCKYDLHGHSLQCDADRAETHHAECGGTVVGCPECGWNRAESVQ